MSLFAAVVRPGKGHAGAMFRLASEGIFEEV